MKMNMMSIYILLIKIGGKLFCFRQDLLLSKHKVSVIENNQHQQK